MRGRLLGLAVLLSWRGVAGAETEAAWIHGFLQGESGYRLIRPDRCPETQRRACEDEFVRGGERLQVELAPRGERWGFLGKAELIHDAISGDVEADLREGYLDVRFPAVDVRLGRQIITWGVGDLIFITDVFPKNRVALISGLPIEYLKKGSDAVNTTAHWAGTSLQLVAIPRFEADTVPDAGGRLSFYDPRSASEARRTDEPTPAIDNLETGLRISRNVGGWDVSLSAYRGFFHTPAAEVEPGPRLRFFFPPLAVYGATAQGAALGGVLSLEAGYYDSRHDRSGRNPAVENSSVRLLTGYQREVVPDLLISGQYYVQVMEDREEFMSARPPGSAARPRARHVLTLRLTQLLLHQTLRLGLFVLGSPNQGDIYVNPEVKYNLTDALSGALGVNLFDGPRPTEFGQFKTNSNLYLVVRYAF